MESTPVILNKTAVNAPSHAPSPRLPPVERLQPRLRVLLPMLLGPCSEKEIAASVGLRRSTVHGYAVRIYRYYGVDGRIALLALWLIHYQVIAEYARRAAQCAMSSE